jgi:hypothetical protein
VIAGRATPADGPAKCFGFVQTDDTKPKRGLLISPGMQANQAVTFRTDGGDEVRDLPLYLNPDSEHLLDWFHLTMRLTIMTNMAKSLRAAPPDEEGLPPPADPAAAVAEGLQRLKWFCWHGNVVRALYTISDMKADAEVADPSPEQAKFVKPCASSTPTSGPTPAPSPTTASATGPAKSSPARWPSPPSTR